MVNSLTRKQQAVLDFLRDNQSQFPAPPTLDELCIALNLKSRGSLHKHIHALTEAGYIEPANGTRRGIRLAKSDHQASNDYELPLQGKIAAGQPIEALPQPEFIEVPRYLSTGSDNYVLQVDGESMIEDGILDGDLVVIEPCSQARNGEIIVALIEHSDVTLKRIQQQPGKTILHPANSSLKPMEFHPEQVTIQGKLVGLIRQY
ncbi:MAG: transcriptional repressor LexA [Methylococcales bacterium]|jgi:repressor LexA|nr:transcriptional repressor LexA [Methylococcales bacterium]MBT7445874.1 transcriptional repressor LexA [Methylococcales bacterium]